MTEYILMNNETGHLGIGIKMFILVEPPNQPLIGDYTVTLTKNDDAIWAIKADHDQPFVVIFDNKIMDKIEILGEL